MEIIQGLIKSNPKAQSAEEIIPTLCDRLSHSKLASDRRAAILTLKGFSREYRELVVANGLRGLISTLNEYSIDTDILKACLETLLILFIRGEGDDDMTRGWISHQSRVQNGKYPSPLLMKEEASHSIDQFSLWISDEFTQDESNISSLVLLLENDDFYVRLYTLQFLEALVSTRPQKTKDSLLNAPLGIPTLIQVLDDPNDPVRNETVLLLMAVANDNFNIQTLVAFENTFDKLFEIIHEEGDVRGSIVVQDCLTLLSNLLKYNSSNQKLFFETNCLPKLAYLISEPLEDEEIIWNDQRLQNITIALEIVRLFVTEGNDSTKSNQKALFKTEIFLLILRLAFSAKTPNSLRTTALLAVADLISHNIEIQLQFSSIDVPYIDPSLPTQLQNYTGTLPVIVALLNWCLYSNSVHVFDIRAAAANVLESYFKGNDDAKLAFVEDQIAAFRESNTEINEEEIQSVEDADTDMNSHPESGQNGSLKAENELQTTESQNIARIDERPPPYGNIFQALLEYDPEIKLNPYKIWFASVILINIIHENEEIKEQLTNLTTGDEDAGEEVLTAIQSITGLLLTTLRTQDQRIAIGYSSLLIVWLYEDFDAVNGFLSDISNVKALLAYLSQTSPEDGIAQGLITILLGIAFEFSSTASPTSRVDLHALIIKSIGKDNYGFKLLQFKQNKFFSEFRPDDIYEPKRDDSGLPQVFFTRVVVSLIKDNYYRIKNVLNQDPTKESNGKISYEKFQELKIEHQSLKGSFEELQSKSNESRSEIEELLSSTRNELTEITNNHDSLTKELKSLKGEHTEMSQKFAQVTSELTTLNSVHNELIETSSKQSKEITTLADQLAVKKQELGQIRQELTTTQEQKKKAEDGINKMSRELFQLTRLKNELENQIKTLDKEVQKSAKEQQKLEASLSKKTEDFKALKLKTDVLEKELKQANESKSLLESQLAEQLKGNSQNAEIVEQLSEKLRSLANSSKELTSQRSELEEELTNLKISYSEETSNLKKAIEELNSRNAEYDQRTQNLKKEKEELSKTIEDQKQASDLRIEEFSQKHSLLQEDYNRISGELSSTNELALDYEKRIQSLSVDLNTIQKTLSEKEKSHELELNKKNTEYEAKLAQEKLVFEDEKALKEKRLSEIQLQLENLNSQKSEITKKHTAAFEESKSIQKKLNDEISVLKDTLTNIEREHALLQQKHREVVTSTEFTTKDLENEVKTLKATIEELSKSKEDLETELDENAAEFEASEAEYKKTVGSLKQSLNSAEEEKKSLTSTLEMISQRIEVKDKEYESAVKDLKLKGKEAEELRKEIDSTRSKLVEAEAGLLTQKKSTAELQEQVDDAAQKLENSEEDLSTQKAQVKSLELKIVGHKTKHQELVKKLEKEIGSLKSSIETKSEEFEKERHLLTENSSSSTKEYSEKVTKLEEELQKTISDRDTKVAELEKQKLVHEERIEELESKASDLSAQLTSKDLKVKSLEAKISTIELKLKESFEEGNQKVVKIEELNTIIEKSSKTISDLEEDSKRERENASKVKAKLEESEAKAQETIEKFETEVLKLKDGISSQESTTSKELKIVSGELTKIREKNEELEASLNELEGQKTKLENSKLELSNEAESKIALLQKEKNEASLKIDELETEHTERLDVQKKTIKSLESKYFDVEEQLKSTITESQEFKSSNSKLTEEIENLKSKLKEFDTLKRLNAELKKSVDEKETFVPRSELDDLMLVLDDLDEKKKLYKQKTKELGGEVSEDEEDDEDEDSDSD